MTKEEIINGNVVIANYLEQHSYSDYYDVENHEYPDGGSFFEGATDTIYHKSNLLYHYHWDWLEDAINKIKETSSYFTYNENDIIVAFSQVVKFIVGVS